MSDQTGKTAAADIYDSASVQAIDEYLTLMEETESPREFLIWSLIATAAGLIGRNAWFESGPNHIVRPNLFVVLIGPAGVKKSTAIRQTLSLADSLSLNYGPTDTGGQRHGLMAALTGVHRAGREFRKSMMQIPHLESMLQPRVPSDMFLAAPELGRLMGQSNREMADFFVDLYDGATIDYQTKAGETVLKQPLVTLLGGTTPSSLASILPDNAATHGILSRTIFVYADQVHKQVPIPPEPTEEWLDSWHRLKQRLYWIDGNRGNFRLGSRARELYVTLYPYKAELIDPRLESYQARRADHLLRVSICLAALRNDTEVIDSDILIAHDLLTVIEPKMRRALEFFGKSKLYVGRMLILNYLRSAESRSGTYQDLIAAAASELTPREADEAIQGLVQTKEITIFGTHYSLSDAKNTIINAKLKRDP